MNKSIFDKSKWKKVRFGDIAVEYKKTLSDNEKKHQYFIGLEHIDPNNLQITKYGVISEGISFTKTFKKGDILFGRRRAYQKKAAIAPFDGICSSDILVFTPHIEKIDSTLFPFIVQNDYFFDYAMKTSAGSLSPRTKFKDLANFEFLLPPLDEQKKIADLLWSVDRLRSLYAEQVNKLVTFLLTYFIHHYQEKTQKLSSISDLFIINPTVNNNLNDEDEVDFIGMEDISEDGGILATHKKKYIEVKSGYKRFETDDILFAKITPCMENGKGAIVEKLLKNGGFGSTEFHVIRPKNKADTEYIFYLLQMPFFRKKAEAAMVGSAGQKRVPKTFFESYKINYPSSENRIMIGKKIGEIFDVIHDTQVMIQKSKEINDRLVSSFFG
jgi:type I restriction enzyme S subunit